MGCLILILTLVSPRVGVLVIWLVSDWVDRAFDDGVVLPILGIVFLPWTTTLYVLGYIVGDQAAPWGILGIVVGLFLDIAVDAGWATRGRRQPA